MAVSYAALAKHNAWKTTQTHGQVAYLTYVVDEAIAKTHRRAARKRGIPAGPHGKKALSYGVIGQDKNYEGL